MSFGSNDNDFVFDDFELEEINDILKEASKPKKFDDYGYDSEPFIDPKNMDKVIESIMGYQKEMEDKDKESGFLDSEEKMKKMEEKEVIEEIKNDVEKEIKRIKSKRRIKEKKEEEETIKKLTKDKYCNLIYIYIYFQKFLWKYMEQETEATSKIEKFFFAIVQISNFSFIMMTFVLSLLQSEHLTYDIDGVRETILTLKIISLGYFTIEFLLK
jgi:hypothetical protein